MRLCVSLISRSRFQHLFIVLLVKVSHYVARSEYSEFEITNPMLITSLRIFEQNGADNLLVFKPRNGSAIVKAAGDGLGIMVVVQEMNLQDIMLPQGCLDHIQMSQVGGKDHTSKLCGHFEASAPANVELSMPRPSFIDKSGFVELSYLLMEKTRFTPPSSVIVNFNLSFTPFSECPEDAFPFGNSEVRPCSTLDTFSCIPTNFFCDGVINCGFSGEIGLDEQNCPTPTTTQEMTTTEYVGLIISNLNDVPQLHADDSRNNTRLSSASSVPTVFLVLGRQINGTILASATILVLLIVFAKISKGQIRRTAVTLSDLAAADESDGDEEESSAVSKCPKEGPIASINLEMDIDRDHDPVPSYEECLLLQNVYRQVYDYRLSCENVRSPPPSYEEVGTQTQSIFHW